MMTNEERQITDAFMSDFRDLLRRYNATFDVCGEGCYTRAEIDFDSIYDENGNTVRPYIQLSATREIRIVHECL